VAAGRIGLQAQQRGARSGVELAGQRVERLGLVLGDVGAVGRCGLLDAALVEQPAQVGRGPERAAVLVGDPVVGQRSPSRVFDIPGRRDCGRKRTSMTRSTPAASSSATSASGASFS
jgi:hypothetical protein